MTKKESETVDLLGAAACLKALILHEEGGNGGNTVGCDFEREIVNALHAASHSYPLDRYGCLSHGGCTVWGDRMIDAGRALIAEREAKAEILRRCRGASGDWVMRVAPEHPMPGYEWAGAFRVCDLTAWTSASVIAEGDSWLEVLANLPTG